MAEQLEEFGRTNAEADAAQKKKEERAALKEKKRECLKLQKPMGTYFSHISSGEICVRSPLISNIPLCE